MEEGIKVPNLTLSHFVNLLQIDDEEQRTQLAKEANRDHLSARQILNRVRELTGKKPETRVSIIVRKMAEPRNLLEDKDLVKFLSTKDKLRDGLSAADRIHILDRIEELKKVVEEYETLLEAVEDNIVEIHMESRQKTA